MVAKVTYVVTDCDSVPCRPTLVSLETMPGSACTTSDDHPELIEDLGPGSPTSLFA